MKATKCLSVFILFCLAACLLDAYGSGSEKQEIAILHHWRGDYPVSEFRRFPEGQHTLPIGYLGNEGIFSRIWQAFKPGKQPPDINFRDHIVVFARNETFYNRIGITKVLFGDGVAEILTIETRSASPIEDRVGMALAVISRAGVKCIERGKDRISVTANGRGWASDPLNATYIIQGQEVTLQNGRSEVGVAPDSSTKIRTFVSGDTVDGDLDGDGDIDAAFILVHDTGGSGTFYYVAVAEKLNCHYQGTNAVRLGDRIAPMDLQIRKGVVIVRFAKRRSHEPMSTAPSVEALLYLTFDEGKLKALKPLGTDAGLGNALYP